MGAARRLVRARLATLVVCAGGVLLALPAGALADGWSPTTETVTGSSGATAVATSFDASTNLAAIWTAPAGASSNVRGMTWAPTSTGLDSSSATSSPSVAVAGGTSIAAWVAGGVVHAATGNGVGGWDAPAPLSAAGVAASVQTAIVGGNPTVFWLQDGVVVFRTFSGGIWTDAAAPAGAPGYGIAELRVAVDSIGTGIAAWLHGTDIQTATISAGTWTIDASAVSSTADATSTLAVAVHGATAAVAWSEPVNGLQVAISTGAGYSPELGAKSTGGDHPALAFTPNGQLFAAYVVGTAVTGEFRAAGGAWSGETSLGAGSADASPAISADSDGDVAVTWAGVSSAQMRAYDTTPPTVTIVPPADLTPGTHTWSSTTTDLWSKSGGTYSWTFNDGPGGSTATVQHVEQTPGVVTAHLVRTDAAGNQAVADAQITISSVGPTNSAAPTVSVAGSLVDGTVLTVHSGSWSANPDPVITHRWQRCTATCGDISGATGSSYTLKAADVGFKIVVVETASNTGGQDSATSARTGVVAPLAVGHPTLVAGASPIADGVTLTASTTAADWNGATGLTFSYQFQRCKGGCSPVQTSGSNTYVLGPADVGATVQVTVVATAGPVDGDSSATATMTSVQTQPVAPKATAAPTLSGTARDTQILTAASPDSAWNGATSLAKTYVFTRCDIDGSNCAVAQSSSSTTYTLKGLDLGRQLTVTVSASSNGSAATVSATSAETAAVTPSLSGGLPGAPTGSTKDGATLNAPTVTWADPSLLTISYQWVACSASTGCNAIAGATGATYVLQPGDVGMTIRVTVTASVTAVPAVFASVPSGSTAAIQPQNSAAATITSPVQIRDGETFGATTGAWHGATGLDFLYVWERCDQTGSPCQPIAGATGSSYTAGVADVGQTLRVTVSASKNGSASTGSPESGQTPVIAPLATAAPDLTGAPQDGQLLTASSPDSSWHGAGGLQRSYQFYRCDSAGANCSAADPASGSSTYSLSWDDIGFTIKVVALASKNGSSTSASGSSQVTSIIRPTLTATPAAPTGSAQDGQVLTAQTGSWLNQARLSFRYQYLRCSPTCTALGAPSAAATYTLQPGDVGNTIQVAVTAAIGAGATIGTSSATLAIAPFNTGVSSITAPAQEQDGQSYSSSDGVWDGATGLSVGYQWKRCDMNGGSCTAIQGATGKTYTSGPLDVGQTLRSTVSAAKGTSARTFAAGDSPATGVIAPRNTVLPSLSGSPVDGQVLTAGTSAASSWDGAAGLAFAYQWLRCDAQGNGCTAIAGATATTYTLTPEDVAAAGDATHARKTLRVRVVASINGVSTPADSNSTPSINPLPTTNTTLPVVTGDPIAGTELSASSGGWSGTGVFDVSFQWIRCDPPFSSCTNVGTPSLSARYVVQPADVGHYVSFVETVSNRLGQTATRTATFSKPVISNVMRAETLPAVTPATYVDGTLLTTSDGSYSPAGSLTFSYKWVRCPGSFDTQVSTSSCPVILHATSPTYRLTPDDVGSYVISQVHAVLTQDGLVLGSADTPSEIEGLPLVRAAPPVNTVRPAVTGLPKQDVQLTATPGTWTGTNTPLVPITFSYQWLRCDTTGGGCVAIDGATAAIYSPSPADVGRTIVIRVTGSNAGGSQSVLSSPTATIVGLPATSTSGGQPGSAGTSGGGAAAGAGGGITSTAVTTDRTRPRLVLTVIDGGVLKGGSALAVDTTCPKTETSCRVVLHVLATLKKPTGKAVPRPVSIAGLSVTLSGGQKKLLKLTLSSAARTALKKSLRLKVTLTARVTDAAGNVTPKQTKGLTLRWKKP